MTSLVKQYLAKNAKIQLELEKYVRFDVYYVFKITKCHITSYLKRTKESD